MKWRVVNRLLRPAWMLTAVALIGCNAFTSVGDLPEYDTGQNDPDMAVDMADTGHDFGRDIGEAPLDMTYDMSVDMVDMGNDADPSATCGVLNAPADGTQANPPLSFLATQGGLRNVPQGTRTLLPRIDLEAVPAARNGWDMLVAWSEQDMTPSGVFRHERFQYDQEAHQITRTGSLYSFDEANARISGQALHRMSATQVGFNYLGAGCDGDDITICAWFGSALASGWSDPALIRIFGGGDCIMGDPGATRFPAFAGGYNAYDTTTRDTRWVWFGEDNILRSIPDSFAASDVRSTDPMVDYDEIHATSGSHVVARSGALVDIWEAHPLTDVNTPDIRPLPFISIQLFDVAHLSGDTYATLVDGDRLTFWDFSNQRTLAQYSIGDLDTVRFNDVRAQAIKAFPGGLALFVADDTDVSGSSDSWSIILLRVESPTAVEHLAAYTYSGSFDIDVLDADLVTMVDGCDMTVAVAVLFGDPDQAYINVEFVQFGNAFETPVIP